MATLNRTHSTDILNPIGYLLMKTEKSQTYTPEFRESSVKLALDSGQSIEQTAEGSGINTAHYIPGQVNMLNL